MSKIIDFDAQEKGTFNKFEQNNLLFLSEAKIRSITAHHNKTVEDILNIRNSLHQLALIMYEIVNVELNNQLFNKKAV
jgi:hypothetical protein